MSDVNESDVKESEVVAAVEAARQNPAKVAFSSLIGTTIEWYDYYIFGTAAVLIFNSQVFPNLDSVAATLASLTTLAVAFVARPIGGLIFGHFGDRIGRKTMLVYSIGLMGAATFIMGLLPTYSSIGIWSAILLVALRFAQGFAVGGEWGGAVLMALEHAPRGKRAFYSSFPQCGVPLGLVLSSGAFYLVQKLPEDSFQAWGWRIPFLASFFLVVVGLYVRLKISESPEFVEVEERGETARFPIADLFKTSKRALLCGIFSVAAANGIFWMATVYFLSYGTSNGIARSTFFLAIIVGAVLQAIAIPLVAIIGDRYGLKLIMIAGAIGVAVIAFPVFALLQTGQTWAVYAALILSLPIGHGLSYACVSSFVPELFAPRVRYTGAAMAYQISGVVTSAPVPILATFLYSRTGGTAAISLLLIFGSILTIVAVLAAKTRHADDDGIAVQSAPPGTDGALAAESNPQAAPSEASKQPMATS
jgi:MFS family permease